MKKDTFYALLIAQLGFAVCGAVQMFTDLSFDTLFLSLGVISSIYLIVDYRKQKKQ
ncbi:MAG: hypothetical protein PUG51_00165 [Firmicutes bacterium]|nr:hypothetical protein [Bacillota bacterium]